MREQIREHCAVSYNVVVTERVRSTMTLDLRGIKCPLNWAHAKVRLEQMTRGEILELVLDDPRSVTDIPRAAEAEGYALAEIVALDRTWRLRIEK
jgi:TusA-related sulfurtransferase